MPICTVPSIKSADGNIYKAYGGLRLKKFLDAFQKTDSRAILFRTPSACAIIALPAPRQPGPNNRCPCGSGRKFKRCHGLPS